MVLEERAHVVLAIIVRALTSLDDRSKIGQVAVGSLETGGQSKVSRVIESSGKDL